MTKETTNGISGEKVKEWIKVKGFEGARAELNVMADEIAAATEKLSDIFNRHPECVVFHGLVLEMKVDAHAGDVVMPVCSAKMGHERYKSEDACDGKCSFGSGCKDGKKKRFEELIKDLDPEEKTMLAMLAIMGGIKK